MEALKAVPRFELGVGLLQSPALPLGDTAALEDYSDSNSIILLSANSLSKSKTR